MIHWADRNGLGAPIIDPFAFSRFPSRTARAEHYAGMAQKDVTGREARLHWRIAIGRWRQRIGELRQFARDVHAGRVRADAPIPGANPNVPVPPGMSPAYARQITLEIPRARTYSRQRYGSDYDPASNAQSGRRGGVSGLGAPRRGLVRRARAYAPEAPTKKAAIKSLRDASSEWRAYIKVLAQHIARIRSRVIYADSPLPARPTSTIPPALMDSVLKLEQETLPAAVASGVRIPTTSSNGSTTPVVTIPPPPTSDEIANTAPDIPPAVDPFAGTDPGVPGLPPPPVTDVADMEIPGATTADPFGDGSLTAPGGEAKPPMSKGAKVALAVAVVAAVWYARKGKKRRGGGRKRRR